MKEWTELALGALSLRGSISQTRKQAISPALLLGYSHPHGDLMRERTAQGIAKSLNADFLCLNVEDIASIFRFLYEELRRHHELFPLPDQEAPEAQQTFGLFLMERTRNASLGEAITMLAARPAMAVLEYLELCMGSQEKAALRRVIYITTERGSAAALESPMLFNEMQTFLMERRVAGAPSDTLFIISEGSSFDPQQSRPGVVSIVRSRDDEQVGGAEAGEEDATIFSTPKTASLTVARKLPMTSGEPFAWLFDPVLCAPRVLIVPPKDAGQARQHHVQIARDQRVFLFHHNYKALRRTLKDLGRASASPLVSGLPSPADSTELQKLMPPVFMDRIWSQAELITLCLSILAVAKINRGIDAIAVVIEAIDDFSQNRSKQAEGARQLKPDGGPVLGTGERLLKIDELDKHEKRLASCIVRPDNVRATFDDIGALDAVKKTLHELISLRLERPDYFTRGILRDSVSGILLFGPPGTGKTMLAKAVAAQSGANFIAVNSSSIFDMYVGEGEKNVKALFNLARKITPCIIFVDEVDALLDSREHSVGRASRVEIINEFMSEWDGLLSSQNNGITVLAATNRPFALDDAVLRRLPRRILVDLPDAAARAKILQLLLRDDALADNVSLAALAEKCVSYSGSDLKNLCMAAAMRALRRVRSDPAQIMTIHPTDLEEALNDVPASISEKMGTVHELREWDQKYGEGRHRTPQATLGFVNN